MYRPETPYSVEEQIQLVEQAITDGADAILITPADSTGIVPAIEKANAAGIPIATPNTKAYGGDVLTWIGVDNYTVGYELGTALCEALEGTGKVVLIEGTAGNSTSTERVDGYLDAFKNYPGIELLDSQPADFNREKGYDRNGELPAALSRDRRRRLHQQGYDHRRHRGM